MSNRKSSWRIYQRQEVVTFCKTREAFGGLSNMASGYPVVVNGMTVATVEALYQACRYPQLPEVQRRIMAESNPVLAKRLSREVIQCTRPDWMRVRIIVMRWCLRLKLAQHPRRFGELLRATGGKPIVELSYKDQFWGAKPQPDGTLAGVNALGRLLMELRELYLAKPEMISPVLPPAIPDFFLCGQACTAWP